ncbi:MAG: hypothetical protein Q8O40_08130 [Chloroflexota bacterium]|nr:hypothetical protein [Chloroflexota bacterium]
MARGFYSRAEIAQIAERVLGSPLAGQTPQGIYQESIVQKYLLGSPLRLAGPDGRAFRYAKAQAALGGLKRLVVNANYAPGVTGHVNEDGYEGQLRANAAIGSTYLDISDTALRVKDYYQGGKVVVYGVTIFHEHHIVRSDPGTGVYVRLYLDEPVAVEAIVGGAPGVSMGVTAYLSPFSAVAPAGSIQTSFETFVGLPPRPVTIAYYFWLQVGGPCIITPTGGTWPGAAANLRDIYANPADGTIQPPTLSDPSLGFQRIGSLLSATGGTASDYGDLWVNLQLDTP